METAFCVDALQEAMDRHGQPEVFNRGGRLRRGVVTPALSGASAGWHRSVPVSGCHAGRVIARPE
jgi:hypothetical protein